MRYRELVQKIALLKDGQVVRIDGLYFSAKKTNDDDPQPPCLYCNVDCLCHDDVNEVCNGLDFMSKSVWYLHLES